MENKEFKSLLNQHKRVLNGIIEEVNILKQEIYDNILTESVKQALKELSEKHRLIIEDQDRYIEENKDREIIGYDPENFIPLYKDVPKWTQK